MMIRYAAAGLLAVSLSWGQAASFEVASVKPAAPCCAPGQWRESKAGVDRLDFPNVTLRYAVAFAYGVKEFQVSGSAWLGELRYDIVAKGPAGTVRGQLPEMMQTLLAQRFQLQVHKDQKEYAVFALVTAKNGPKLKESALETEGAKFGMSMTEAGVGRLEAKNATMLSLANTLVRLAGRPVMDLTELPGRFDLDLEYSGDDPNVLFTSLQRVGLRLDSRKVPMDTIWVDRAERVPIEN